MLYTTHFRRFSLVVPLLLLRLLAGAQTPQPTAASPTLPDLIVRTNGAELPARVLVISSTAVRYFGVPDSAHVATDTLTLARAEVFMVRFANGTKEVMAPPTNVPTAEATAAATDLAELTLEQRYEKGRTDAQKYKPSPGIFWGTFGATMAGGVLGGVGTGAAIGLTPPKRENIVAQAPRPQLLEDPSYYQGFEKQAQNRKLGKAAAGFGVGMGTQTVLLLVLLTALLSSWTLY